MDGTIFSYACSGIVTLVVLDAENLIRRVWCLTLLAPRSTYHRVALETVKHNYWTVSGQRTGMHAGMQAVWQPKQTGFNAEPLQGPAWNDFLQSVTT